MRFLLPGLIFVVSIYIIYRGRYSKGYSRVTATVQQASLSLLIKGKDRGKPFYPRINKENSTLPEMSRHHMCPNRMLKGFWNALIQNQFLEPVLSEVLGQMKVRCDPCHTTEHEPLIVQSSKVRGDHTYCFCPACLLLQGLGQERGDGYYFDIGRGEDDTTNSYCA